MSSIATLTHGEVSNLVDKVMKRLVVNGVLNTYVETRANDYGRVCVTVEFENVDGRKLFHLATQYMNIINEHHDYVYACVESFHHSIGGLVNIQSGRSAITVKAEHVGAEVVLSETESEEQQFAKPLWQYTVENNFISGKVASFIRPKYMYDYVMNALHVNQEIERRLKEAFES